MENLNIPKDLISKCNQLITGIQKKRSLGEIPKLISTSEYMPIISSVPDGLIILKSINAIAKLFIVLWVCAILVIILSIFISKWFLLILIIFFIIGRFLFIQQQSHWLLESAILLSIEMLVNNFAGWGNKYSSESQKCDEMFDSLSVQNRNFWLDYILPDRDQIAPETIEAFGPEK